MKVTALAPANIAFIKYWGKANAHLRLPLNSSISMNLSGAQTTTTVEFANRYTADHIEMVGEKLSPSETERIVRHLDLIRQQAKSSLGARVVTKNSFPKGVGIASSASGFAALTVAACTALGLHLAEKELTILARLGSGSACRSIPDGFVLWQKGLPAGRQGTTSETSYAFSLYPPAYWDLRDVLVIVQTGPKSVATSAGMEKMRTSPFWRSRVAGIPDKITAVKQALAEKNLQLLGEIIEEDTLNMHAVAMTQRPPLFYWNDATMSLIKAVGSWRREGLPVYFSIDAGPNVHLICEAKDEKPLVRKVRQLVGIKEVMVNTPAKGAHLTDNHLF